MTAAPGDAMSDAWQMVEVAKRLGHATALPTQRRDHVAQLWNAYRTRQASTTHPVPSIDSVRRPMGARWPVTAAGETTWRFHTEYDPRANKARGAFDFYGHTDGRAWLWIRPVEAPVEAPTRTHPFWLSTGAVLEHAGSGTLTQRIPELHTAVPAAYAEFHADDARRLGLKDNDRVRIANARGAIEVRARVDFRSQPQRGVIFVPSCDESVAVAALMPDAFCPVSGQPERSLCAVRVERLAGAPTR
jgi:nitrate reductase NapA